MSSLSVMVISVFASIRVLHMISVRGKVRLRLRIGLGLGLGFG